MDEMKKSLYKIIAVPFLAAAALLFAPACSDKPEEVAVENEMNVVLITIDTLRADRLGCYGYDKPVSRMIDALATRGVQFNNCVSQSSVTPISHASILTGQNPYRHGVRTITGGKPYKLERGHSTIATLLKAAGYETAAFISAMPLIAENFGLDNGFDIYEQSFYEDVEFDQESQNVDSRRRENPTQRRADLTNELAIDWLRKRDDGPFFMWLHYFDVHETYLVPPVIPGVFTYEIEKPLTDIHSQMYDVELRFIDQMISNLVDELYRLGVGRDTLIVITSDHGQGLNDHDYQYHGMKLYQEQIRVPLIFVGATLPAGLKPDGLVRSIDIAPTILDIIGYPSRSIPAGIEGLSLRAMWEGRASETEVSISAYSETSYPKEIFGESPVFSVTEGGLKFISYPESRSENELFDLSADPMELNNIISERPERAKELEKTIARMQAGTVFDVERSAADDDKATRSLLKSLGYLNK